MKKVRVKKQYPEDAKTIIGISTLGWSTTAASCFMASLFMLYLTDYSGIKGAISAAALGTMLLFVGRIVDAIDDPLQGWIMDSTKPTKWGKYKPYCMLSTIIVTISIVMLYSLPQVISKNTVLTTIWVVFFYLLYDIGASFYAESPLRQTLSTDEGVRAKLATFPRVIGMFVVIPFAFFLPMVKGLDSHFNNMHTSFAVLTIIMVIPICIISLIGASLIKEGAHNISHEESSRITMKDMVNMFKTNKPFLISQAALLFGGFIWTIMFATTTYYIKWAYCVDMKTGIVDGGKFATYTSIMGVLQMLTTIFSATLGASLIKKLGSIRTLKLAYAIMIVAGSLTFILKLLGLVDGSPALYFVLLFVMLFGSGLTFVPGTVIGMECGDYALWKTGKEQYAILNAVANFISKAQVALSSAGIGLVLVAVGYKVDSVKDQFTGQLSTIPTMLTSFIVFSGLVPAILAIIAFAIYRHYPINDKIRGEMKSALEERRKEAEQLTTN